MAEEDRRNNDKEIVPGMKVEATEGDLGEQDVSPAKVTDLVKNRDGNVEAVKISKGNLFRKELDVPSDRIQQVEPASSDDRSTGKVIIDAREEELGPWIGSPLIIEVKRTLRGEKDCNEAVQQTLSYLQLSQTRSALILYASKTSSIGNLSSISPPNVFFLDIHELLNAMRTKSFAKVMIDLRNRRVHGINDL